jgi:type IV pilus assembly protein PilQ
MKTKNRKRLSLIVALCVPLIVNAQDAQASSEVASTPAPAPVSTDTPVSEGKATPAPTSAAASGSEPVSQLTEITPPPAIPPTPPVETKVSVADSTKPKDTLSVDFPDEDIRSILRNVADLFELNIVIPDTLQGRTSIKLRDVSWRQIFSVTLSPVGYTFVEEGNIIKVISKGALDAEPFVTSSVILQNVAANSIESVLKSLLTTAQAATATSPAVMGGSLVLNAQANEYIITDKPVTVQRIIEAAKRLDTEPRQVVIETKFVEVSASTGFEFSLKTEGRTDLNKPFSANQVGAFNTFNQTPIAPAATLLSGPLGGTGTFNAVLNTKDYSVLLQALQSKSGSRIVSNPTVVAVNGSKSTISVGQDIQLVKKTENTGTNNSGTSSLEKDGTVFEGVKVEVTPQITSKKLVSLAVKAQKTIASESKSGTAEQKFYDISTREATLNMLLLDGQTAAIGGLIDKKNDKVSTKVPLLGDIPLVGNLFKTRNNKAQDTNLIIFITASILEPSKTSYKNMMTGEQLYDLNLTDRDIRGVSYEQSAEEARLLNEATEKRQKLQDSRLERKLKQDQSKAESSR